MKIFMVIVVVLALLAVLGTLVTGVVQMVKGNDARQSNRLMQQRVLLQGLALGLFLVLLSIIKS
jgi:uncharacterized membrane protein